MTFSARSSNVLPVGSRVVAKDAFDVVRRCVIRMAINTRCDVRVTKRKLSAVYATQMLFALVLMARAAFVCQRLLRQRGGNLVGRRAVARCAVEIAMS